MTYIELLAIDGPLRIRLETATASLIESRLKLMTRALVLAAVAAAMVRGSSSLSNLGATKSCSITGLAAAPAYGGSAVNVIVNHGGLQVVKAIEV